MVHRQPKAVNHGLITRVCPPSFWGQGLYHHHGLWSLRCLVMSVALSKVSPMNINEQHCGILRLYNIHISSVYHHVSLVSVPLALGGIRKKPRTHNLGMVTTISFATSRCYNHLKSIQIHQTTHQQIHQNSFKSTNNPLKNPLRSIKKIH